MNHRPLELIIVCRSFPAHRAGGMEWHAQDIVDGLMEAGHRVHVVTTPLPRKPALRPLRVNGTIKQIGTGRDGTYSLSFVRGIAQACLEIDRRHAVDLVHAQGFTGMPLAFSRLPLPPFITTIHGTLFSETALDRRVRSHRPLKELPAAMWAFKHRIAFWPLWRAFLSLHPNVIVDSRFTRRELLRECGGLDPSVVPLGIDLERYPPRQRKVFNPNTRKLVPRQKVSERPLLFFSVGRLEKIKGFGLLLRLLAATEIEQPWHFVIAGNGPELIELEKLTAELSLSQHVHFTGRLSQEELIEWFASADLFLNADQGQPAFGLTNAEALVMGCPVLASNVGAHREVVREKKGDGEIVSPFNRERWLDALQGWAARLPEDDEIRYRRQKHARSRFDRELMIKRLEKIYFGLT